MRRVLVLLITMVLFLPVLGCGGKKELKGYRVSTDTQEMVVWSTTEPELTQAGWADQEDEQPIPSWIVLSQGLEEGEKYVNTIAGQNPRVEKFHSNLTPVP